MSESAQEPFYAHPETGEVLTRLEDFRRALGDVGERMAPLFATRRALREEMSLRFDPPPMPRRTGRTEKQELIARCPRCGTQLEPDPPSAVLPSPARTKEDA